MKFLGYILRNARRNPVRSVLTVASIAVCLFLMMILLSFLAINDEVAESTRVYNRLLSMGASGFSQPLPIASVREIAAMDGVVAASPFNWYGGKYHNEINPFAQFAVDADTIGRIFEEIEVPPDQEKAFRDDPAGCLIGVKLAEDRGLKLGDPMPLQGDLYPVDLDLTVRGIYDAPPNRDRRMCMFHWDYLDEKLKQAPGAAGAAGNAGAVYIKCENAEVMPSLCKKIDDLYRNSATPSRTQTEEAFIKMFSEMIGDLRDYFIFVGMVVVFSLTCVAGMAMAMSLRERTREVAVLKAIGFSKSIVLGLVLAEAILIAGLGGVVGALGSKLLFDTVDVARYSAGFVPFFYVSWPTALVGLGTSLGIGLASGLVPAIRAAQLSVIDGLRRVV